MTTTPPTITHDPLLQASQLRHITSDLCRHSAILGCVAAALGGKDIDLDFYMKELILKSEKLFTDVADLQTQQAQLGGEQDFGAEILSLRGCVEMFRVQVDCLAETGTVPDGWDEVEEEVVVGEGTVNKRV